MDIKQIQDLIQFVADSGVSEVHLEQDDIKLTIKTAHQGAAHFSGVVGPQSGGQIPQHTHQPQPGGGNVAQSQTSAPQATPSAPSGETIKSPMIGTFYRRASPNDPIFVSEGDMVRKGQVVCIIEAMKLFNEIESEVSGRIVKVLVEDANPVEYDQPLFLVEPA